MSTDFQAGREALGARLAEVRAATGLNGKQFAQRLGWPASKVSRLQAGKQTPAVADLEAWAAAAEQPELLPDLLARLRGLESQQRHWRRQLAAGHAPVQDRYVVEYRRTATARGYEATVVPGLFQTPDTMDRKCGRRKQREEREKRKRGGGRKEEKKEGRKERRGKKGREEKGRKEGKEKEGKGREGREGEKERRKRRGREKRRERRRKKRERGGERRRRGRGVEEEEGEERREKKKEGRRRRRGKGRQRGKDQGKEKGKKGKGADRQRSGGLRA
ncbi:helix-turn-helix transcriptional regulator [Streptomyces showdoensis]|uniref:helix-turn-helix domain-containing protein n=1 Tax=Streptomyces showdoensis TaxID=68268 RepID=UPI0031F11380